MRALPSSLLATATALLRKLASDRRGSVSVYVGAVIVPLVAIVGVSIDAARGYSVKSQLSSAVDAAALAGGRIYGSNFRDADIQKYFDANFPPGHMNAVIAPLQIAADDENRTIAVSGQATIPTTFMRLLGFETLSVSAQAEAKLASKNVEVALVLDITGSMDGSQMTALKEAANELVDIIVQDVQTPFYSRVALVPYSMGVNVGSYANAVRGTYTTSPSLCTYPDPPTCQSYRFPRKENSPGQLRTLSISTCVTERTGPEAYTDAPPTTTPLGRNFPAPDNPCLTNQIVPLTSNRTLLHTRINGLTAAGSTAGHIGTAWGWYLVSPKFGYLWPDAENKPAAYGSENLLKVVILMTDGEFNTVYFNGVNAKNSTGSSGDGQYKINVNSVNGSSFYQAEQLCNNMKAAGVIVYTVGLELGSLPAAREIVQKCATSAGHVYLPESNTSLKDAFRSIAMQISTLRLSK